MDKFIIILDKIILTIEENENYLTELDREIGDSDHGINLNRGFQKIKLDIETYRNLNISEIFNKIAMSLISNVGGASGAIYGSAFMKASIFLKNKNEINDKIIYETISQMVDSIKSRGKATFGEKTILDTIIPVNDFIKKCVDNNILLKNKLNEIKNIAKKAMEDTKNIKATKGRASYLGDRSIGHIDPGAYSSYLIIKTICENI